MIDLRLGNCLNVMKELDANSIDSIVTDPPYGLSFMGKDWDHGVPGEHFWVEALRVAKPGAHLLAFGGTRTFHRLAVAIEDAGWEIRDCVMWVYGSGFPKSHDVSKAIDREAGASREVVGRDPYYSAGRKQSFGDGNKYGTQKGSDEETAWTTSPATPAAKQWEGWGTALKPAWEPIIVARKPFGCTVAQNVQAWGTGAINVDGCRVPTSDNLAGGTYGGIFSASRNPDGSLPAAIGSGDKGRWPANFIHDGSDEVLALMPDVKTGGFKSGQCTFGGVFGNGNPVTASHEPSSGSAARFFYCAKSSKSDRNIGLDGTCTVKYNCDKSLLGGLSCKDVVTEMVISLQKVTSGLAVIWLIAESGESIMGLCQSDILSTILTAISKITTSQILNSWTPSLTNEFIQAVNSGTGNGGSHAENAGKSSLLIQNTTNGKVESARGVNLVVSQMLSTISDKENWLPLTNFHSTVKPTALMRYLCKLVTPSGGIILDPFMGSGSTGKAAVFEGFGFIGIDLNPEYIEIAKRRIEFANSYLVDLQPALEMID